MEQLEKQDKTVRKLKKQLKVFAKKIGELEGTLIFWEEEEDFGLLFVILLSSYPSVSVVGRALASVNWFRKRDALSALYVPL